MKSTHSIIDGKRMDFILEWWKQFLALGFLIVGAGALAWLRSTFVTKKSHEESINGLKTRLSAVENTVADMPSAEDIHELDKRLIEVGGKIDSLSPQLGNLQRVTDLLMENELREKRSGHN
ncbi:DUF2730 domain-containing protein [Pseudoalteromonas sp. CnMc7-15]|uniref:DUF2730 family protein n=1 Tax=unclassified Pseudoalteromonas TaxID=194690 RepID=UPI001EF5B5E3|nr:DUF2730 family protein [Pseudoalteromonas sp. CnMc7-15]MCG7565868.1 DUF2730 domain-containing protein [Pseudoalteromonas sp. CnMc7-15]